MPGQAILLCPACWRVARGGGSAAEPVAHAVYCVFILVSVGTDSFALFGSQDVLYFGLAAAK